MNEHRVLYRPASLIVLAAALASCAHVPERSPGYALTQGHPVGIWKAAIPLRPMNGEFRDFDPVGLAAGALIKADCSLNWTNPDDGRLYCFVSGTSLEFFLEQPQVYIERAATAFDQIGADATIKDRS